MDIFLHNHNMFFTFEKVEDDLEKVASKVLKLHISGKRVT